jgi:tRNA dimethylallyltransferase
MKLISSKPILIVTGPTASGKSGFALAAAEKYNGVIINCDSMQVYTELRLITARPSLLDETMVSHKLYGTMAAESVCSVGKWRELAIKEIEACWRAHKIPIITGGTGLYIKALIDGLAEIPPVPKDIRDAVTLHRNTVGHTAFHYELGKFDPVSANKLNPADSQRMIRAYTVYATTNRTLSDWHKDKPTTPPLEANYTSIVFDPPRDKLYARCEMRFDWMVRNGALDEVRSLMDLNLDSMLPVMKALGVRELVAYLENQLTLEDAVSGAKRATRNYAKRQMTWFRNQLVQECRINEQYSERLLPRIFSQIFI